MRDLPPESVDMVLCDLPFGLTRNEWDKVVPLDALWEQYHRVCKPNAAIVLHCMQPFTTKLIGSNLKEFKYCWYWDKHLKTGFLNAKKQPLRQVEEIAVFYRKQPVFDPPLKRGRAHTTCKAGKKCSKNYGAQHREGLETVRDTYCATTLLSDFPKVISRDGHPTAKPLNLCEYLIRTYSLGGAVVLDNCMGCGTTGIACVNTDRSFIGIELNKTYYDIAVERINNAQAAKRLNGEATNV